MSSRDFEWGGSEQERRRKKEKEEKHDFNAKLCLSNKKEKHDFNAKQAEHLVGLALQTHWA